MQKNRVNEVEGLRFANLLSLTTFGKDGMEFSQEVAGELGFGAHQLDSETPVVRFVTVAASFSAVFVAIKDHLCGPWEGSFWR